MDTKFCPRCQGEMDMDKGNWKCFYCGYDESVKPKEVPEPKIMGLPPKITIEHIGWVSNNLDLFEKFWVGKLGFKRVWESEISEEKTKSLFGISFPAKCYRYELNGLLVELHVFENVKKKKPKFDTFGINHVCLHVDNRREFIEKMGLKAHIYKNPEGHENIFINDYEGNWIELRETI